MILCSALPVRELFAETILRGSQHQSQTELISLAWVLRNRAQYARYDTGNAGGDLALGEARHLCRAMLADLGCEDVTNGSRIDGNGRIGDNGRADAGPRSQAFQQALACVSLVCDGLVPDPTHGATRAHAHDTEPEWAQHCEATALIGELLFFRGAPDASEQMPAMKACANDR
ncbi:MAG: hypothetical protein ACLFPA_12865 [Dichotomicrobium sp.]